MIEQRVRVCSEAGGGHNDDDHDDSNMAQDGVESSNCTTDAAGMQPSPHDAGEDRATRDDRPGQPNVAAAAAANDNEAGVHPRDATAASAPTTTETNSDDDEDFRGIGHRKYLLYSTAADTGDRSEETSRPDVEQKQSVVAEDASNEDGQLTQQVADETSDNDNGRADSNDKPLKESTNPGGETAETEHTVEENGVEKKSGENDGRRSTEAVENNEELIRNEESEPLPSENRSEETVEHLRSAEDSAGETCMPQADRSESERDALTPDAQTSGPESVQQNTTNGEPESMPDRENEEPRLLGHGETGEQHDTNPVGETTPDTAAACDGSSLESAVVENEAGKNAYPTKEPAEKQTSEPPETSAGQAEVHAVDSVQKAGTRATPESAEPVENATAQRTGFKQSDQDHLMSRSDAAPEQSDIVNSCDIETEQRLEATKTAEQSEPEVAGVEDESTKQNCQNSEGQHNEAEGAHVRDYATDKEDEDAVERSTADGADMRENSARTTDKLADESDTSVEATSSNHPVDDVQVNDDTKTGGQHDKNAPDDGYDEPDKTVQRITERSRDSSETRHDKPAATGVDEVSSQQDGYSTQEVRKDDAEDVYEEGKAIEGNETPPEQSNATPAEMLTENVTNATGNEERGEAEDPAEKEKITVSEIVDNAESRKSAAENDEEQIKQLQGEQTEPTTAEAESQPTASRSADEPNETATNKPSSDISEEEEFSTAVSQSHDNSAATEEVENRPKSAANAVDESSAAVGNEMCETVREKAAESSQTTETVEDQPAETSAAESQAALPASLTGRRAEKPETDVVENSSSHSDQEATSEHRERNDENASDAENADEVEFVRIVESDEEPDHDVEDKSPPDAAAVEPCGGNSVEVNDEGAHASAERETEQRTETASESGRQFNENCTASDTRASQRTEVSEATDSMGVIEADNKSLVTRCAEEQSTKATDGDEKLTDSKQDSAASDTDTTTPQMETATKSADVGRTYESNENVTSTSDEVFEAAAETDKVSAEEISHREVTDNDAQSTNARDNPSENEESIRRYVDGCRDVELSGIKLSENQVRHNVIYYINNCLLF